MENEMDEAKQGYERAVYESRANEANVKMASREKTRDECGIEQKVEQLLTALQQAQDLAKAGAETASNAMEMAAGHQHGARGEVLVRPAHRTAIHERNFPPGYRRFDPLACPTSPAP